MLKVGREKDTQVKAACVGVSAIDVYWHLWSRLTKLHWGSRVMWGREVRVQGKSGSVGQIAEPKGVMAVIVKQRMLLLVIYGSFVWLWMRVGWLSCYLTKSSPSVIGAKPTHLLHWVVTSAKNAGTGFSWGKVTVIIRTERDLARNDDRQKEYCLVEPDHCPRHTLDHSLTLVYSQCVCVYVSDSFFLWWFFPPNRSWAPGYQWLKKKTLSVCLSLWVSAHLAARESLTSASQ